MRAFIQKYYIQLIIIILLVGVLGYALYQSVSVIGRIATESQNLKEIQLRSALMEEFLQRTHVLHKSEIYIEENISYLQVLLPNEDNAKVQLFSELERISEDTGNQSITLAVKDVDVKTNTKTKKSTTDNDTSIMPQQDEYLHVSVALVGSYSDLMMFLRKVENMQYLADVTSIAIEKTDDLQSRRLLNEENVEEITAREDLLHSDIDIVFYLDSQE